MATPRKTTIKRNQRPRERAVPVRVVKSDRPRTRVPLAVSKTTGRPLPPQRRTVLTQWEVQRRRMMWGGVVVASGIIFIVWISMLRFESSTSGSNDTIYGKIKSELSRLFTLQSAKKSTSNTNSELEDLRNRVFPNINTDSFETGRQSNSNGNSNVNARTLNINGIANTNSSL